MLKKIKLQLSLPDNKKLLTNFISLSILQVVSFVLPLVVVPYLIIVLGVGKFGIVAFAQAVITYFVVFTDYGFNLSATRDISINRNNSKKVSSIFNSVLSTKLLLGIFGFIILLLLVIFIPKFNNESLLFLTSFTLVIGQILFPIWFFQGVEQMKFITYLTVTSKLIFTVLIFIFIKTPSDYILVNIFQGIGNIISGIISVWFIQYKFKIKYKFSSISRIIYELKNGWHILVSSFSINIYISSNIIILGFFASPIILGYYSIAEKVMMALRQLLVVFSQVVYPHVSKLTKSGHDKLIQFYKRIFIPFFIFILICSLTIFIFTDKIVIFLVGKNVESISTLIRIFCLGPLVVCLNIPANQTLLIYNKKISYSMIVTFGAIFSMISCALFSFYYSAIGTCISIVITETLITIGLYLIIELKHKENSLFHNNLKSIKN